MLAQTKAGYLNWLNENGYGIWDGTTDDTNLQAVAADGNAFKVGMVRSSASHYGF